MSTDAFFRDGASDGRALHLTLGIYDDTSIILPICQVSVWSLVGCTHLKVEEKTVTSAPSFALADNDGRHRCTDTRWVRVSLRIKIYVLFLRSSGFPFFTDATTMSPTPASGRRFRCEPKRKGSMTKRDFAPLLSAQLRTAPTGRPRVSRNLFPAVPAPVIDDMKTRRC